MTAPTIPPRSAIPQAQTWNKESVYADLDAWHADYQEVESMMTELDGYAGTLSQSPDRLADWLEAQSMLERRTFKLYFYAVMSTSVDGTDDGIKALVGQAMSLYGKVNAFCAFTDPEILAIGEAQVMAWVQSEPRLNVYAHAFQDLFRQQQHVLSREVEEVLGLLREPFENVENIASELGNSDLRFDDARDSAGNGFPITQGTLQIALQSPDRALRRSAWNNYSDAYLSVKNTFAQTYLTSVKQSVLLARLRRYDSVLSMKLAPNALPLSVFHNLIATFQANIKTWHRFWDVKRRLLGQDTLQPYDIWAPMASEEPKVSYEQSVDWISEGLRPLGEDYVQVMRDGCLKNRWVDYAINEGKRQGAFSFGTYDTMPFIMMSYDDSLGGMSTLAHELGHSMHSYYTRKDQPHVYGRYSMFVAEVASNFNQAMTRAYLFETHSDRNFTLALIQEAIDNFHRYFFIMPTLARFEYAIHTRAEQNKPLSTDFLLETMRELYAEGYGTTMTDDPQRTAITWAQFLHLYEPYYTFQYATGISAAHALAQDIRKGDEDARQRYRKFLSAGSSLYPIDALKMAGVDMSTPHAIEQTYQVLSDMVDRLESLIV
jgi:oligoendopeptidase F